MPSIIRPRRGTYARIRELIEGWQIKITLPSGTYKDTYVRWIEEGECRLWTGTKRDGYPYVTVGDEQISVAALIIRARIGGLIPKDKRILRTCGNRACVNPDHLKLGDQSEAMKIAMSNKERFGNCYLKKMAKEKKE